LTGADLSPAWISDSPNPDVRTKKQTDLSFADLTGANLTDTNLTDIRLYNTTMPNEEIEFNWNIPRGQSSNSWGL
jgi:uncharacterized protein YjbI with pentapeptide repeats